MNAHDRRRDPRRNDRISGSLAARVKELAERYDAPVTTLASRVGDLEAKVNEHLRKMGFAAELSGAKQ